MSGAARVLILGGTTEAFALAAVLCERPNTRVLSSLAGRVAHPRLPAGNVRIGGFGGVEGLADMLQSECIDAVIDATHPFADRITRNAHAACRRAAVPLLRVSRAPWAHVAGDTWHDASDIEDAARIAASLGERIFVTTGRQSVAAFAPFDRRFIIRTIDPPAQPLPANHLLLLQRGPFTLDGEIRLMREHAIDVLVTKNSGGDATYAKIAAARELRIPVVMVQRPQCADIESVDSVEAAAAWAQGLS